MREGSTANVMRIIDNSVSMNSAGHHIAEKKIVEISPKRTVAGRIPLEESVALLRAVSR